MGCGGMDRAPLIPKRGYAWLCGGVVDLQEHSGHMDTHDKTLFLWVDTREQTNT